VVVGHGAEAGEAACGLELGERLADGDGAAAEFRLDVGEGERLRPAEHPGGDLAGGDLGPTAAGPAGAARPGEQAGLDEDLTGHAELEERIRRDAFRLGPGPSVSDEPLAECAPVDGAGAFERGDGAETVERVGRAGDLGLEFADAGLVDGGGGVREVLEIEAHGVLVVHGACVPRDMPA